MSGDFEGKLGFPAEEMFGMTREEWEKTLLKAAEMSCDEQVKLLERTKNEKNIEGDRKEKIA